MATVDMKSDTRKAMIELLREVIKVDREVIVSHTMRATAGEGAEDNLTITIAQTYPITK